MLGNNWARLTVHAVRGAAAESHDRCRVSKRGGGEVRIRKCEASEEARTRCFRGAGRYRLTAHRFGGREFGFGRAGRARATKAPLFLYRSWRIFQIRHFKSHDERLMGSSLARVVADQEPSKGLKD